MKLNVFLNHRGIRRHVGILSDDTGTVFFEYSPSFLNSGISLSPFKLPLRSGIFTDEKKTFDGLFGLFNDSLPDGWGCLLLDRKLRQRGYSYSEITPLMRLSLAGMNSIGALEYEPADSDTDFCGKAELDSLSGEIGKILSGAESDVLDQLLKMNGSSGGSRPKITALVSPDRKEIIHGCKEIPTGYTPWIIKFAGHHDPADCGEMEYRYSMAAKEAGTKMPDTHLFPLKKGKGCFGIQRFDRIEKGKVHIHTVCGLLHASHRYPCLDYENLLKLTLILTQRHEDVVEMARRMVFNVKSRNRDDHSKNFSFLLDENCRWHLSPAYDITFSEGINGEHTSMVNGKGKDITDDDLRKAVSEVSVSKTEMDEIITAVNDSVHKYHLIHP